MGRSKAQDKLVLVKHEPGIKAKRRITMAITASISAFIAYSAAYYQLGGARDSAVEELVALEMSHDRLNVQAAELRQQVANLESGRAIDDLAKKEIQDTIRDLKAQVTVLEKDVSFYQNIMAPSDKSKGLQVQNVEIKQTAQESVYDYKVVLAQVADNKAYLSGLVAINVIGMADDKQTVLPLRDISDVAELGIKFRFRYFQDIAGELRLPEGFKPTSLQVVAQSKGKKASRLEQSFGWHELLAKNS